MRSTCGLFGLTLLGIVTLPAAAEMPLRQPRILPLETMTFDEVVRAHAAGTGCTWLGGKGFTRRIAMKEDRGVVKRGGQIIMLQPAAGAKEVFPYTYHRWAGSGMDIAVEDSGKRIGRGYEHVETIAMLTLTEGGRTRSWPGRLNCGS